MTRTMTFGALALTWASILGAQAPSNGPRAGAWAAEATVSSSVTGSGGSVLRFWSNHSALLLGLNANVLQRDIGVSTTNSTVGARVGLRSLRSPGSSTRPILGAGVVGSHQRSSGLYIWEAGLYTEVGLARFFGESFSLGAVSELQVRRGGGPKNGDLPTPRTTRVLFDAVRLMATVYF